MKLAILLIVLSFTFAAIGAYWQPWGILLYPLIIGCGMGGGMRLHIAFRRARGASE